MTQQSHSSVHTQKNLKQGLEEIFAHPCSQRHDSQQPKGESNPGVHQHMMDKHSVVHPHHVVHPWSSSAMKRREALTLVTMWMDLENTNAE